MQAKCEWGFTDKPDFPRICRELASQGAVVGRVTMKGEPRPVTLVLDGSTAARNITRLNLTAKRVAGTTNWLVLSGDHVGALLEIAPVKVEGFAPTEMLANIAPGVSAASPSAAPIAPVPPLTAYVQRPGVPGVTEYLLGRPLNGVADQHVPTAGNAWLDPDGKVYLVSGLGGQRKLIGYFCPKPAPRISLFAPVNPPQPVERHAIFVSDGTRSGDYPTTYVNREAAETALEMIPSWKRRSNGYHVRAL